MNYLLDTDTLIDIAFGQTVVADRLRVLLEQGHTVAVCPITITELYSGVADRKLAKWEAFFAPLPYWHINRAAAKQAGLDRRQAVAAGRTHPVMDSLIGAVAREHDATVLTSNTRHFEALGVKVLSLRRTDAV